MCVLSRLGVLGKKKTGKISAGAPEGNLMTLDNMKPERGMCATRKTRIHRHMYLPGVVSVWVSCAFPAFSRLTVPTSPREESGQRIM